MSRAQRSGYQPIQTSEDESDLGGDPRPSTSHQGDSAQGAQSQRRGVRPGNIDLTKLDNAFKRYLQPHWHVRRVA